MKEIDNSHLPKLPGDVGPVIIGRTRKGPALKPVRVDSYADFIEIFGETLPGNEGDDVWREGNGKLAAAYAPYAASAYFSADISSPVTMIRLLGVEGDDQTGDTGQAGWSSTRSFGMFVFQSGSSGGSNTLSGSTLAAVFYAADDNFEPALEGCLLYTSPSPRD